MSNHFSFCQTSLSKALLSVETARSAETPGFAQAAAAKGLSAEKKRLNKHKKV